MVNFEVASSVTLTRKTDKDTETTRQPKIARLLQKELSEIFRQQTAKTHGVIISVSAVRVTPDLSIARAYLSVFPSDNAQTIMENINRSAKTIRYELAAKVRYQLRKTPELQFYLDDSLDYIENIDHLLEK
ncbi:MAG: 30S ribosome-binding factor RbfA [Muribaculaceae bacterium]|nr:30S ribosome-binding factor RbfA [Muribaculaceae bacterium]